MTNTFSISYLIDILSTLSTYTGEIQAGIFFVHKIGKATRLVFVDYAIVVDFDGAFYVKHSGVDYEIFSYYYDGKLRSGKNMSKMIREKILNMISNRIYDVFMKSLCVQKLITIRPASSSADMFHLYFVRSGIVPINSLTDEQRQAGGWKN